MLDKLRAKAAAEAARRGIAAPPKATPCPGCGSLNQHHFSDRVGTKMPAILVPSPEDKVTMPRKCETTGCSYRATSVVVDSDGATERCEGCTNEGLAFGWWERLTPAVMTS